MNPPVRPDFRCSSRARSSFPVPVSPRIRTREARPGDLPDLLDRPPRLDILGHEGRGALGRLRCRSRHRKRIEGLGEARPGGSEPRAEGRSLSQFQKGGRLPTGEEDGKPPAPLEKAFDHERRSTPIAEARLERAKRRAPRGRIRAEIVLRREKMPLVRVMRINRHLRPVPEVAAGRCDETASQRLGLLAVVRERPGGLEPGDRLLPPSLGEKPRPLEDQDLPPRGMPRQEREARLRLAEDGRGSFEIAVEAREPLTSRDGEQELMLAAGT
ncbi:MAG: hypothetical protein ACHQPI_11735 [Thermoanaerobaculia bacterium]